MVLDLSVVLHAVGFKFAESVERGAAGRAVEVGLGRRSASSSDESARRTVKVNGGGVHMTRQAIEVSKHSVTTACSKSGPACVEWPRLGCESTLDRARNNPVRDALFRTCQNSRTMEETALSTHATSGLDDNTAAQ